MIDKSSVLSRIVGVEEHFNVPSLVPRIPATAAVARGFLSRDQPFGGASMLDQLADTDDRLHALDAAGLTVQVLSLAGPGADLLPPSEGVRWAQEANNALADKVAAHPTRYAGFAHLPLTDPAASADELERTVRALGFKGALISGATDGRYLDHPSYEPLLARAEALDVLSTSILRPLPRRRGTLCTADCPASWVSGCRSPAGAGTRIRRPTSFACCSPGRCSAIPG